MPGPGQITLLTDHGLDPLSKTLPDRSREWRELLVSLLHYAIIEPYLGIPAESTAIDERLLYTPDAEQAYWSVESSRHDLAFLLPPTRIRSVEAIAAGRRTHAAEVDLLLSEDTFRTGHLPLRRRRLRARSAPALTGCGLPSKRGY